MCPKIQSACLFPLKMHSLKNPDPRSLCKKWGIRVSHIKKPPVFRKKNVFFATTRVIPFFSGNSKGDLMSTRIPSPLYDRTNTNPIFQKGSKKSYLPTSPENTDPMVLVLYVYTCSIIYYFLDKKYYNL